MMCNILQQAEMSKTTNKTNFQTNKTNTKRHRRGYLISFDWHSYNHVIPATGCIGDDGKCYDIGDELTEDCSKFTCTAGGVMQESDFGKETE